MVVGMRVRIECREAIVPGYLSVGHDPLDIPADQAFVRVDGRIAERVVVEIARP
jgi:hypothetical protein